MITELNIKFGKDIEQELGLFRTQSDWGWETMVIEDFSFGVYIEKAPDAMQQRIKLECDKIQKEYGLIDSDDDTLPSDYFLESEGNICIDMDNFVVTLFADGGVLVRFTPRDELGNIETVETGFEWMQMLSIMKMLWTDLGDVMH